VLKVRLFDEFASRQAFKEKFKSNSAELRDPDHIRYVTCNGGAIEIRGKRRRANGRVDVLHDRFLFDSALIYTEWLYQSDEVGKITIRDETTGQFILDFRDLDEQIRIELPVEL